MKKSSSSSAILTLDDLNSQQWAEIHEIARVMYEQEKFGGNQFKCTIHAFVLWLGSQEFDLAVEVEEKEPPHELH